MEMYCPECMGALAVSEGKSAKCTIHGGVFRVLFQRTPTVLAVEPPLPTPQPGGSPAAEVPMAVEATDALRLAGPRCVQHPHLPATRQCQSCGAHMCATCDFELPSGMHFCPPCATKPQTALGSRRKGSRLWAFVLAIFATLGMAALFSGVFAGMAKGPGGEQALGLLFMLFVLVPAIAGLAMALGAIDRRLANPPSLWAAAIWNGLIVALFLLACLVGTLQ